MAFVTCLLVYGVKESIRANNIMVLIKLLVLGLFVVVGVQHIDPANYVPFAPNGWTGIHQGAAIVFFAYIGFDAISTAAEETKDPQKKHADRHHRWPGDLHPDLRGRGVGGDGHRAVPGTARGRSAGPGAQGGGTHAG